MKIFRKIQGTRHKKTQDTRHKPQDGKNLKSWVLSLGSWVLNLLVIGAFMQMSLDSYGKDGVPERDYRIAVVLFNEAEYEAAESKFSIVIQQGDLSIPKAAAYVVNSYYGRASCRIEQGRKLKESRKLEEALDKYSEAYEDLSIFKSKFEELQETLRPDPLYEEMEKHFVIISDQIVQLAGEAGDICFDQGKYEGAIEWYDKGSQFIDTRSPTYGDLIYAKANAVSQLNNYEEALRLLTKFESELYGHKLASNALFDAAEIYVMMADSKDAEVNLEKACDAYGRVVAGNIEGADVDLVKMALLEKGRCEKKLGRMDEALADFREILTYYPDTQFEVDALLEIGEYSFRAKRYNSAIESFDRAIKVAKSLDLPDRMAISYYWIGWSYFSEAERIDTESSPEMAERSRKLYEQSIDAFEDSVKNSEKFWKKEGREVQMAKELEGYHGESLFRIGKGYQKLGEWDDAIEAFQEVPRFQRMWWLKGLAEIAVSEEGRGNLEVSLAKWNELKREIALANVPDIELELLMRRAESMFFVLERYADSEKAYREIITKYPNSPNESEARINLALSLFKQDKSREAIQEFTVLLDKYGKDDSLEASIGEALFWRGYLSPRIAAEEEFAANIEQAVKDYKELVMRFPDHPRADDAQYEIGFSIYSLGGSDESKYPEAIVEYSKILQNYPESEYSDDALYDIGRCYRLMGNETKEEESLRQLVLDYPTSELADDALRRVADIHFERAQGEESHEERLIAENTYSEIISKYPGTQSEAIAHFQMGAIFYKFDSDLQTAAAEFAKCAEVIDGLLDRVVAGEYVPVDLDVATTADLLLRSTFWQAESMFQSAKESEDQAQPSEVVKQAYRQARGAYQQLLTRGTRLRSDFPESTQNLYNIMGGEKLDIPIIGEAQYMISRCLHKEGDLEGAKAGLQSIKAPEKLRLKAEYLLATIAYELGELHEARTMAENWLNNDVAQDMADEYNVGVQVLLAKIALASGNISEAKAQALDTWALFNSVIGLWEESAYIVAKSYQQQSDMEKARSWFEKLQDSALERWRVVARDAIVQLEGP